MKVKQCSGLVGQERGAALFVVVVVVSALATLSLTMVTRTQASYRESRGIRESQSARYIAEAGLNRAYVELNTGGDGVLGSEQAPLAFGGGEFWVENTDLGSGASELISYARAQGGESRSQLVLQESTKSTPVFGVFGDDWLTLDSNTFVDSYNSSIGTYSAQKINGSGSSAWANAKGNTGSNGNISLDSNAAVHGDANPGVTSATTTAGKSTVSGSTLPIEEEFVMPEIIVPTGTSLGDLTITSTTTLGPGTFFYDELLVSNNDDLQLVGPITLVVDSLVLESNSTMILDATGGGAEIYVKEDFILNSNVLLASGGYNPGEISLSIVANNIDDPDVEVDLDMSFNPDSEVVFDSNSVMFGTIVAPNALISLDSNFELYGSLMARQLHLDSNSNVHFDESLNDSDEEEEVIYEIVGWVELPGLD
ncbi:MAG: hypothetical protein ACI84E_001576 [Planctomycetota bacterium]|jgi:hypothetical protein